MSERCERKSERRSEWPSTLRVDFIVILPAVHGLALDMPWTSSYSPSFLALSTLTRQAFPFCFMFPFPAYRFPVLSPTPFS